MHFKAIINFNSILYVELAISGYLLSEIPRVYKQICMSLRVYMHSFHKCTHSRENFIVHKQHAEYGVLNLPLYKQQTRGVYSSAVHVLPFSECIRKPSVN